MFRHEHGGRLAAAGSVACLAAFVSAAPAFAQMADLGIAASPEQIIVTPLREQSVQLVARNAGPNRADDPNVSLGRRVDPATLIITPEPKCEVSADTNAAGVLLTWNPGPLDAGATESCWFTFRATAASESDVVSFGPFISQPGNIDPNNLNDTGLILVARSALDRPTDIALTAQRLPGGLQPPGTTQRVELTIRNLGPGTPDRVVVFSPTFFFAFPFATGYRGYDIFPRPDTLPCSYFRDEFFPAAQIQLSLATPIPVGGSVRCSVDLVALDETPVSSTLEWNAFVRGAGVYDVDQSDNRTVLQIPFQAPLPVPLSPLGWMLLSLLVGATGWVRARRARA